MGLSATCDRMVDPWNRLVRETVAVGFVDTLLRGTGQVMFQNNPIAGLLFLLGIFYNSYQLGIAGVIGLLASTVAAMVLGADRNLIRAGLFGFNGILTALLSPLGMPALTAPFVLSAWLFLLPKASFHALQPVPLAEVAAPEQIRRRFLEKERAASVEGNAAQQGS
jgi:urea transporter